MPDHTTVPLKEHLESRIQAIEKSIEVANASMQNRLATMNEFREQLKDQATKFITRPDVEAMRDQLRVERQLSVSELKADIQHIVEDVEALRTFQAKMEGKASQSQVNIALLISVVGTIIAILGLVVKFVP